ncbi:MAG: TonB-dependent receptor [Verrucomicrobia bacterium]|nr:TonB-dependent receptor [Verrucomicrobiota bacterium]
MKKILLPALSAGLVFPWASALAQTSASSRAGTPARDELIHLTAFTVSEKALDGYIASESVTGTRVATQIKDLPFSVSVITSEFMTDFDFFDLGADLAYTASLNGVDTQGNSTLRGYGGTFTLRNGFYRLGLNDRINTDRIEIIKGPNAAIYGATSPAGLVNYVSKRPKAASSQLLRFTAGSDHLLRGELNVNSPLGSIGGVKLFQLFSAQGENVESDTRFAHTRKRFLGESILAQFKGGATLLAEFEWSSRESVTATSTVPYEYNLTTRTYSSRLRPDLGTFSQGGPDSEQDRESSTVYLTFEQRLSRAWSLRAGGFFYRRQAFNFNTGSSDQFDPVQRRFGRGNTLWDPLNEDGGATQVDVLADTALFGGAVQSKTLLTLDYSQNWRYRQQRQVNSRQYTIAAVFLDNPDYSLPPHSAFAIVTRNDKTRWDTKGFFLRQQATALAGRLIAFAGLRRDSVTYNFTFGNQYNAAGGALRTPGLVSRYTDSAWSPSAGFNFKLVPGLAVYASRSESFTPAGQSARLGEPHLENETSEGWDYGFKGSFLRDRLSFTVGGFYIDRFGVKTTVRDPVTGLNEVVAAGTQRTKGFEFEGSWRATDSLTLQASFSSVHARILYNGNATTDVGRRPAGVPDDQASFVLRHAFRGPALAGLSWNAGVTFTGEAYPNSTATDARRNVRTSAYTIVNAGITYAWRAGARTRHSVRLSSKNLFDREYLTSRADLGADRGIFLAYALNH